MKNIERKWLGCVPLKPSIVGYDSSNNLYEKGLVATIELLAMTCLQYEKCIGGKKEKWNISHPVVQEWLEWADGDELLVVKDEEMVKHLRETEV